MRFTADERRVAQSILRGEGEKRTCERLNISRSRYKTHVHHLLEKTGSHGQVELVAKLRQSALVLSS